MALGSSIFQILIKLGLVGSPEVVGGLKDVESTATSMNKRIEVGSKKWLATWDSKTTGKDLRNAIKGTGEEAGKSAAKMGDLERAMRRAIVVAPVWMVIRAAIQQVTSTIKEGFNAWMAFDAQIQKSRAVIHGYAGSTDEAVKTLEDTIRSFSKESGMSLDQLTSSFYRFGTVGIAFQDSLSGAIASAKLAKATFADVDTISRSLAMTYRLLGDTIDSSLSPMEKQESLAGKIYELWKTNAFEANEFSASLNNFISTANIANFTADQTIALLSALGTAGVQGSRGGTLLKTAIYKLTDNLDKLAPTLGLAVNPELESTFELLMRVLEQVNKLSKVGKMPAEAIQAISEIFGGAKGSLVISALNALLPELKQNIIDMAKDPQKFIKGLNDGIKSVSDSVEDQVKRFKNLKTMIGESFVKGIVGGNDFKDSLKEINEVMDVMIGVTEKWGKGIRFITNPIAGIKKDLKGIQEEQEAFSKRIDDAIDGNLTLKDTIETITMIQEEWEKGAYSDSTIKRIENTASAIIKASADQQRINAVITEWAEKNINQKTEELDAYKELQAQLEQRMASAQNELELVGLQQQGISNVVVEYKKLDNLVKELVDTHNELDLESVGLKPVSEMVVKTALLEGNFKKISDLLKGMTLTEAQLNSLSKVYLDTNKAIMHQLSEQNKSMRNQYIEYEKADGFDKAKIRRLIELLGMDTSHLLDAFKEEGYDKNLIVDYWSSFSNEAREAMNNVMRDWRNFHQLKVNTPSGNLPFTPENVPNIAQSIIGATINEVNINIPDIDFSSIAEKAGEILTEKIKSDPQYRKLIADVATNTKVRK